MVLRDSFTVIEFFSHDVYINQEVSAPKMYPSKLEPTFYKYGFVLFYHFL